MGDGPLSFCQPAFRGRVNASALRVLTKVNCRERRLPYSCLELF